MNHRKRHAARSVKSTTQSGGNSLYGDAASQLDRELDMEFFGEEADGEGASGGKRADGKKSALRTVFDIKNLILVLCVCVFSVCAVILFQRWFDYKRGDEIYLTLSESMFKEVSDDPSVIGGCAPMGATAQLYDYSTALSVGKSAGDIKENTSVIGDIHYARIRAKLEQLKQVNDDIIGWIKIDGTQINYPVVLGDDNDYYLTHAYNGEYLRSGTIFADYKNSKNSISENRNTVLYGHNMANGAMFAGVKKFLKEELFNSAVIYFYTLDGVYVYEPVMLLETVASFYYYRTEFSSRAQYKAFLDTMYESAKLKKDVELTPDDKLLSLSTCSNRVVAGRYCLQARLVRIDYKQ